MKTGAQRFVLQWLAKCIDQFNSTQKWSVEFFGKVYSCQTKKEQKSSFRLLINFCLNFPGIEIWVILKIDIVLSCMYRVSSKKPFSLFRNQTVLTFLVYILIAFFQLMIFRPYFILFKIVLYISRDRVPNTRTQV